MVAYMKRYDPGNRMVRQIVREWKDNRSKVKLLLARNHGFCGNWLTGLDSSQMIQSEDSLKAIPADTLLPKWLPANHREGGWVRAWPNPFFAKPSYSQVEITKEANRRAIDTRSHSRIVSALPWSAGRPTAVRT